MATILIIDDEAPLRLIFSKFLTKVGHRVLEASSGDQGLELAAAQHPEVVITDLVMPGKEGLETIIALRRLDPSREIIALSGAAAGGLYLGMAAKLGAQQTLEKPVTFETLLQAVDTALARAAAHGPSGRLLGGSETRPDTFADRAPVFLILDDDADSRFLHSRLLRKSFAGCSVVECSTAPEAFGRCFGQPVDAVLADHHLRGLDGVTFIRMLREAQVTCPILMVTNNDNPVVKEQAYAAGASEVFAAGSTDFIPYLLARVGQRSRPL